MSKRKSNHKVSGVPFRTQQTSEEHVRTSDALEDTGPKRTATAVESVRDHRTFDKKFMLDCLTFLVVAIYAALTWWQARSTEQIVKLTEKQAALLKNQIVLDERPYIKVREPKFVDVPTGHVVKGPVQGRALAVTIVYENTGRSAALETAAFRYVAFGTVAETRAKGDWATLIKIGRDTVMPSEGDHVIALSRVDDLENQSYSVLPHTLIPWDGSQPIYVFGEVLYKDAFGSSYCTPIAYEWLREDVWGNRPDFVKDSCRDVPKLEATVK